MLGYIYPPVGYYPPPVAPPPPPPPPSSPLRWARDPNKIPLTTKVLAVVQILRDLRLSPVEFLITLLSHQDAYKDNAIGFYRTDGLEQLLNVCSADPRGKKKVDTWYQARAIDAFVRTTHQEMDTLSTIFKHSASDITPEALMDFDFQRDVTAVCEETAPKLRRILMAAAQTPRAARENTTKNHEPFVTMIQAQLAKSRSQNNNLCAIPCSFYFLSSGMPRKVIDTLAHAGMNLSYNHVKTANQILAKGQIGRAQIAARAGHAIGWDNIHLSLSEHVEQRTLAPPKVQTGTTTIIYDLRGLFDAQILRLKPILERRALGDLITYSADIRPTRSQSRSIHAHLEISIVELLIRDEPEFDYLADAPELKHATYRPPPSNHKTSEYVLRTTKIDEGSGEGTTQVNDNVYIDQLAFDQHALDDIAVPSYNDQKTNALIRSAQLMRMGDMSAILRLEQYQLAPGAFHVELNLSWLLLRIHRGNGADIGSLQYFIGLLSKSRLGSDKPDFETLVSLLMQVLVGAMQHYLEVETGMSFTSFAKTKPTASELLKIAGRIYAKYASEVPAATAPEDDRTFSNLHLLLRDLLTFYLLRTSISSGDFGRVELLLGKLTMMFSGSGCSNYQTELLYFLQNLRKVWPEPFANLVRDNALISTSGRSYVGMDKNAEFNINFQKNYFASKGVHASWDLLADISPNVPILRHLKTQFGAFLGAPWQGIHHTKASTKDQVAKVKSKMKEFKLHLPSVQGRRVTERETIDILEMGAASLQKTGLKTWGKAYTKWRTGA
ncbi:hypothetical protein DFH07DRAFT_1023425 [Mycena maculata]|uniref:DUF6589 domain-containing protein n=1 Tax=Mycena maculata TaxID=230809 RepID=A0AAD7NH78_9AGAR|nr:hypothetical protein DFH07DRAFT_1023425 [Mycena maculata]